MSKIYIKTSDIFNFEDAKKRMKYFNFCRKKSIKMWTYMQMSH